MNPLDPENLKIVEENCEIKDIIKLLSSTNINTVLSTITTMYYLLESPILRPSMISEPTVDDFRIDKKECIKSHEQLQGLHQSSPVESSDRIFEPCDRIELN